MLISLLELFQQADGSVVVPEALRAYMNGMERIGRKDLIEQCIHGQIADDRNLRIAIEPDLNDARAYCWICEAGAKLGIIF